MRKTRRQGYWYKKIVYHSNETGTLLKDGLGLLLIHDRPSSELYLLSMRGDSGNLVHDHTI